MFVVSEVGWGGWGGYLVSHSCVHTGVQHYQHHRFFVLNHGSRHWLQSLSLQLYLCRLFSAQHHFYPFQFSMFFSAPFFPWFFGSCSFPKYFCSYFMSPFLGNKSISAQTKVFFHFPCFTPSPIIQVQQSRLSQAAGDRGIAEGSWYLLGVRDLWFWIFLVTCMWIFGSCVYFCDFVLIVNFVRLFFDRFGGPTHYIRSGWCKAIVKGWQSAWLCVGVPGDVMSTKIDPLRLHPQQFQMCNVHFYGFGWMFSSAKRFNKVCLCRYLQDHSIVSG